jgi:transposase-like protein
MGDERDQEDDYTGPVCSHCRKPVDHTNGTITSGLRQTWLCDSCAAAQEHEWDRKREEK